MALFSTDSIALCCSDVDACKKWWMESFDCKHVKVPREWDCILPSDVALILPGDEAPSIALSDWAEVRKAGYERSNDHTIVFCRTRQKAHEHLRGKGVAASPIQDGGGTQFFEVRDPEGNVIEICKEP
jgi:catechol 2,3-dioxygenase-like lactoylglutathione lyase family enzyme